MLVDDDRNMTSLLKTLLEMEEDFEVIIAARAEQALAKAPDIQPDLFMVDYHLNDMNGLELVQALRQHPRFAHTPIVVASGLDVGKEALKAGADHCLIKPFEPSELPEMFLRLIQR